MKTGCLLLDSVNNRYEYVFDKNAKCVPVNATGFVTVVAGYFVEQNILF